MKRLSFLFILFITVKTFWLCNNSIAFVLNGPSWPTGHATMYSTGGDSSASFDSAFVEAMNSWNNLSNFQFINVSEFKDPCANPITDDPPWFNGYSFRSDYCGMAFGNTTIAVTLSWISGNEIIQTGTIFNTAKSWDVHHGPSFTIDFRRAAAHELGHALGLGHESGNTYLMNPFSRETIETPQTDDINGIRAIYGEGEAISYAQVQEFVTRFYLQCLNREPDTPGLEGWINAVLNGSISGADVAYGFVFSQEFINRNTSNEEFVTILYRAFFDREPDTGGYNGWVNQLSSGTSHQDVLNGFIYSQEFENLCNSYGIAPYSS